MMRFLICLIFYIAIALPIATPRAADLLIRDDPAVIPSTELRQDLNRALLAVVMKVRGRSAAEIAEIDVALADPVMKSLPDKSIFLAPFDLKETRVSALLPGGNKDLIGLRATGFFIFEDDFLRQFQLSFALDYQIEETGIVRVNWASVGESSPLPPVVSLYVVEQKDMPRNFGSDFHSWQDIFSFAVLKGIDLRNVERLPKGKKAYTVFQFIHSRLPSGDWAGAIISNSPEGQDGEKVKTLINTYDHWKIYRHQVEMDLTAGPPLYFKILFKPKNTGTKEVDGKTFTVSTLTPHGGGKRIVPEQPGMADFANLTEEKQAPPAKAKMVPGKISPISDDGKVRLEVVDPAEGFRLINEDIGYSFLPPFDNWRIAKPDEDGDLIIYDQGGCLMSFAPTSTFADAPQGSPEAFEAYWWKSMTSVKEGEGAVRHAPSSRSIGGMDAMSVRYDTKDGPWHFNYIQLPHRLLMAAFTCPKGDFKAQYSKYDKAVSTLKALTGAPAPMTAKTPPKPATPIKPKATASDGPQRFAEPGFGYTMPYPPNWVYEKPSQWTVVFSGPKGTDSYYSTVTVQNLQAATYPTMDAVVADLKAQLKASGKKHRWHHTLPYLHMDDAGNIQGKQFTMEYWEGKEKLRRSGILIPRPEFGVYHYWSYTAPEALWGESLDLAEAMRDGIQRVEAAVSTPTTPSPLPDQAKKTKPGKRIFNETDGYSFIPPAGWNVTERQRNSVINVTNGNCELRFAMGQIGNLGLEAYADKWEKVSVRPDYMFKKRYNRMKLRFNGLDAVSTEYDTGPNTGLMTFVRLPNEVLGIRATCKQGPLAQVFEAVEYSMKSVTALAR